MTPDPTPTQVDMATEYHVLTIQAGLRETPPAPGATGGQWTAVLYLDAGQIVPDDTLAVVPVPGSYATRGAALRAATKQLADKLV